MRIVLCTDFFHPELGGVQDSVALLAKTLGERGHQVVIYAPSASAQDYEIARVPHLDPDLGENVQVRRLFSLLMPSSTGQSRFVPPTFARWSEFGDFNPDVIHTNTLFGIGLEARHAREKLGIPLIGTNHFAVGEYAVLLSRSLDQRHFSEWALRMAVRYYNRCDFMSAPSQSVIDEMRSWGLEVPCAVVSNPIDPAIFYPPGDNKQALKQRFGFSGPTFVYAGKFSPEKYIDVLVRALPLVAKEIPDVRFALAGHGSEKTRLENLAGELGVVDRLCFLGTLTKLELADVYRASDVFSSASTSETQSMVLMQAMACGLPAVAVRWRAFKEYVPEDAGLLAEPNNPEEIASKLAILLKDKAKRETMGRHAREFVSAFSAEAVADRWESIYRSAIQNMKNA